MYQDSGAFDMICDNFKEMCRVAWSAKFYYLCFVMNKNKNEGKHRIFIESKTTYIEGLCENEAFEKVLNVFCNK